MKNNRIIAINLPQFHPFKENDEWWGKGFTEWTNVTKARPVYKGHYQPHLPSDTGFYDLRLPEARQMQADMAKEYGIYGFCYYHYWFNGKRLMERPVNEILSSGEPDYPFMLCWANENWTRAWDGGDKEILIRQNYSSEDDREHIRYLLDNVFSDKRYIRINGKPVFAIYRSTLFPNIKETIRIWRTEAAARGIELYLCRFESFQETGQEYLDCGFDAAIEFPPHCIAPMMARYYKHWTSRDRINRFLIPATGRFVTSRRLFPYKDYIRAIKECPMPEYKLYPTITPMWDNSARRKTNYFILTGSTPELYYEGLKALIDKFTPYSEDENLIFINAWNEWAEGNHLEPDIKWGRKYLEATMKAMEKL